MTLMKYLIIGLFIQLLFSASVKASEESDLSIKLELTYATKYVSRGYELWDGDPAIQPNILLHDTGLHLYGGWWASLAAKDSCIDAYGDLCANWNEYNYYAGYYGTWLKESRLQTEYDINYTYIDYYKQENYNSHEVGLYLAHPRLINDALTPFWAAFYAWPEHGEAYGYTYILGIKGEATVASQPIEAEIEAINDDGGFGTSAGMNSIKTSLVTSFFSSGFEIQPSINYQKSLKDNEHSEFIEDELWMEISFEYEL